MQAVEVTRELLEENKTLLEKLLDAEEAKKQETAEEERLEDEDEEKKKKRKRGVYAKSEDTPHFQEYTTQKTLPSIGFYDSLENHLFGHFNTNYKADGKIARSKTDTRPDQKTSKQFELAGKTYFGMDVDKIISSQKEPSHEHKDGPAYKPHGHVHTNDQGHGRVHSHESRHDNHNHQAQHYHAHTPAKSHGNGYHSCGNCGAVYNINDNKKNSQAIRHDPMARLINTAGR